MHYLVDGYSVIHAQPELRKALSKRLAHARDLLVQRLQRFADHSGDPVSVFFDGRSGNTPDSETVKKGKAKVAKTKAAGAQIEIVFSAKGQTADMLIERRVGASRTPNQYLVVTADHAIENTVGALGASSISPDIFFEMLGGAEAEFSEWLDEHRFRTKRKFERD